MKSECSVRDVVTTPKNLGMFEFLPDYPSEEMIDYDVIIAETKEKIGKMMDGPTLEFAFFSKYPTIVYHPEIIIKLYDEFIAYLEKRDE